MLLCAGETREALTNYLKTLAVGYHLGDARREEIPMSEHASQEKPLPTIWRVPVELWEKIEPILAQRDPPKSTGRRRIDQRAALDAIIFRLRTGCQWNHLPKEFPDDSRCIAPSRGGSSSGCWTGSGRHRSRSAKNWAESTGSGRRPTARWARRVLGGPRRSQPYR